MDGDNGDNGNEVTYNCKKNAKFLCLNQAITGSWMKVFI